MVKMLQKLLPWTIYVYFYLKTHKRELKGGVNPNRFMNEV